MVETGLALALQELTGRSGHCACRDELRAELIRIEAELVRYAEAIADAGPLETIVQAIKFREDRRDSIRAEMKALVPQKSRELDASGISSDPRRVFERLDDDSARGGCRSATSSARGVPAGSEAARVATGEAAREKGSPRPRIHWRGVAVETFRGLNLCKSVVAQRDSNPCFMSATRFSNGRKRFGYR